MAMPTTRSGRPNNSGTRGGVTSTAPFPLAAEQYDKKNEEEFRRQLTEFLDPLRNQLAALTTVLVASMINNDSGVPGANVAEALDALVKRSGDTMTGVLNMVAASKFLGAGGSEGGEFRLEKPASGSTLAGDVVVDVVNDVLRIFENGSPFKGAFLDLAAQASQSKIITEAYLATQSQAEDGVDNTYLTPLRANQGTLVGTRAGHNICGGGTVTYNGSFYFGWTSRFIVIGDSKGTENPHGGAYTDINQPTSGSIDVVGTTAVTATAAGIPMPAWGALYYDIDAGSAVGASAFHIIRYDTGTTNFAPPPSWVLLATVNNDSGSILNVCNGMVIPSGGSAVWGTQYAPLASPTFTGTPAAPTAALATDTTQIATTAFVQQEINAQVAEELLLTGTISGTPSTLDINLASYTGFSRFRVVLDSFVPTTDDVELWVRISTDGGSTYETTTYSNASFIIRDSAANLASAGSAQAQMQIVGSTAANFGVSNVASEGGASCEFVFYNRTLTQYPHLHFITSYMAAGAETEAQYGACRREVATDVDRIRIMWASGTMASGTYSVYGMR
jgi:hypothetical protein